MRLPAKEQRSDQFMQHVIAGCRACRAPLKTTTHYMVIVWLALGIFDPILVQIRRLQACQKAMMRAYACNSRPLLAYR